MAQCMPMVQLFSCPTILPMIYCFNDRKSIKNNEKNSQDTTSMNRKKIYTGFHTSMSFLVKKWKCITGPLAAYSLCHSKSTPSKDCRPITYVYFYCEVITVTLKKYLTALRMRNTDYLQLYNQLRNSPSYFCIQARVKQFFQFFILFSSVYKCRTSPILLLLEKSSYS